MSKPTGEGLYLVLIDYGSEGLSAKRFKTPQEVLDFVEEGISNPFIIAYEIGLAIPVVKGLG